MSFGKISTTRVAIRVSQLSSKNWHKKRIPELISINKVNQLNTTMPLQVSWLSLLILTGFLTSIEAEVFPQCANAPLDTFVMAIEDCASYIYCNGDDSFRDSCPESTYFDDRTQECAFDDEGVCLRNSDSVLTEELPDKQATGEEQDGIDGTTPVPTNASTGSADSSTLQTDPATPPSESFPSVTTPPTTSPNPSSPSPKPSSPAQGRPHCDASGDGDHPHPQRCEYYYRCLSGYLTIVRCPYKYGWDFPTKQCKPVSEAQCFSYNY
ncbi:uncharacterized protein LOC6534010 [Drosophila yakuba]|nr:uncharacterized protein LOC6534010 [Drosophila yakuba]